MEVGHDLKLLSPGVRYVIYSPLHQRFYETFPRVGNDSGPGILNLDLPTSARPFRLRQNLHSPNPFKATLYNVARTLVDYVNTKRWATLPKGALKEVDLNGHILISLGRPKMMSDFLFALQQTNVRPQFIPLLHDMIPLHDFIHRSRSSFPQSFLHDNRVVIEAASLILTNSEFTKTEILQFSKSGVLPPAPEIIPIPLCNELRESNEPIAKSGPSGPYILCVGAYNGRKNLECVVEAILRLHDRGSEVPDLVLAGAYRKRVAKFLKENRFAALQQKFHFVRDPNQAELRKLYEQAFALVLPSRMEGWGLPVSEALWCGTPALAADIPALREAGKGLALYFNPEKPEELAALIQRLTENPSEYQALKARIRNARSSMRTWRDVARDILASVEKRASARDRVVDPKSMSVR